jgi:hypothetical protein
MVPWAIPDPTPEVSLRDIITTRRLLEVQQILDKLADFMAKVNQWGQWRSRGQPQLQPSRDLDLDRKFRVDLTPKTDWTARGL